MPRHCIREKRNLKEREEEKKEAIIPSYYTSCCHQSQSRSLVLQDHVVLRGQADAGPQDVLQHRPLLGQGVHHRRPWWHLFQRTESLITSLQRHLQALYTPRRKVLRHVYQWRLGEIAQNGGYWVEGVELALEEAK